MDQRSVTIKEEEDEASATWVIPVEPVVEIQETDKSLDNVVNENFEDPQFNDADEENGCDAVQEFDSVLVDKICGVCGNLFQTFELINCELTKRPLLTTCEMCSYYINPTGIKIENNNTKFEFSCDKCPKSFTRKDKLLRHKTTHSKLRPYACEFCEKSYKRHDKLTEHKKLSHGFNEMSKKPRCENCGGTENIIIISEGEEGTTTLNLCGACKLSRDASSQNSPKLFQCDLCCKHFTRKDHATRHRLSHLDLKPYECYICEKSFNRNDRLLRHMKTHPGAQPFSCKVCFLSFDDREELRVHQSAHPKKRGLPQKCHVCLKELRDKDKLKRHLATHLDYKPLVCEICGKILKSQESLLSHLRTHSEFKPFKCKICGMAFKLKDTFKRHCLIHSSATTFNCNICSKTFKRSDKLKAHYVVHVDVKPFVCTICNSAFKRKDKYTRHLKEVHRLPSGIHNTLQELNVEMKNICDICDQNFVCEDDLMEHKMVHY